MDKFVEYIVKNLVDDPDGVSVACRTQDSETIVEVRVGSDDAGKVIGRKGRTVQAIRTVVSTMAARLGGRARVEVLSEG